MARAIGKWKAFLRTAELFAIGIGVIRTQRQRICNAPLPGYFHTLDQNFVDIDILRIRGVAQLRVIAKVGAGAHTAGLCAIEIAFAARDLVVEVVAEHGDVEVVGIVGRHPVQGQLTIDAGLWLEVRVAYEGAGALAAEASDAVVKIGCFGCFIAGAHAAF